MAKSTSYGYTDTAIEGVSSLTLTRGLLNFGANFRVKSEKPGEIVLANISSPVDRVEKIRIAYSEVANIYTGTGIEASLSSPSKKGVSILVQITEVLSVSDSVDADYRIDLPVSYHFVIKVPASEYITANVVLTGIGRLMSVLFDTGVSSTSRLEGLLRGSLTPSDI